MAGLPAWTGRQAVEKFAKPQESGAKVEWALSLEPGPHKLSVRAHAPDTYSISDDVEVEVKAMSPPKTYKRGTLYYIGIGVNQFKNHKELNLTGAVPDVQAMEKCLKKECAGRFVEIRSTVLTDDKATREAILQVLTDLQGKLKPTDVVIVHYSSHGEVTDGGLFLLTHDSNRANLKKTAITGNEAARQSEAVPCPVLLILDACHSGKFPLTLTDRPPEPNSGRRQLRRGGDDGGACRIRRRKTVQREGSSRRC